MSQRDVLWARIGITNSVRRDGERSREEPQHVGRQEEEEEGETEDNEAAGGAAGRKVRRGRVHDLCLFVMYYRLFHVVKVICRCLLLFLCVCRTRREGDEEVAYKLLSNLCLGH